MGEKPLWGIIQKQGEKTKQNKWSYFITQSNKISVLKRMPQKKLTVNDKLEEFYNMYLTIKS